MTHDELTAEVKAMMERTMAARLARPTIEMMPVVIEFLRMEDGEQKRAAVAIPSLGAPGSIEKAAMKSLLRLMAKEPRVLAYFMSMEMWFLSGKGRDEMPPPSVNLADVDGRREGLIVIGQLADGTCENLMAEIKRDADNAVCGFGEPQNCGRLSGDLVLIDMIQ